MSDTAETAIYESVTETAKRYGLPRREVLEYCEAPRQKFAFKSKGGGKWWIHVQAFHEHLERKRKGTA